MTAPNYANQLADDETSDRTHQRHQRVAVLQKARNPNEQAIPTACTAVWCIGSGNLDPIRVPMPPPTSTATTFVAVPRPIERGV
jgi:hypothetical protein